MILCMLMYLFFILECSLSVSLVTNACTYTPTVSLMPSVQGRIVHLLMLARGTHPPLLYKKVSQFEVDQCHELLWYVRNRTLFKGKPKTISGTGIQILCNVNNLKGDNFLWQLSKSQFLHHTAQPSKESHLQVHLLCASSSPIAATSSVPSITQR